MVVSTVAPTLQMENHGLAIADATVALELDKTFIKAYYRRGSALMALARYKEALRDFRAVRQLKPSDKDALEKFKAADKEVSLPASKRHSAFLTFSALPSVET